NIPLHKLRHLAIKQLFTKLDHPILKETSCKNVVGILYERKRNEIKAKFKNNNFFMIVDESQHLNKKYVNTQLGLFSEPRNIFLILCRIKTTVNSSVVKKMIYSVIKENVFDIIFMSLLISDAASYMLKEKSEIQKKHKNIFHITCFAHLLHNRALRIKTPFMNIDFLISSVKMAPIKSIDRREKFVNMPLPPQPIITRWEMFGSL
ncbi:hypothetical protein CDIK_0297, partial [Cucumispora dikerogammari]